MATLRASNLNCRVTGGARSFWPQDGQDTVTRSVSRLVTIFPSPLYRPSISLSTVLANSEQRRSLLYVEFVAKWRESDPLSIQPSPIIVVASSCESRSSRTGLFVSSEFRVPDGTRAAPRVGNVLRDCDLPLHTGLAGALPPCCEHNCEL